MPQEMEKFARIYLGADGMATNGLPMVPGSMPAEFFSGEPAASQPVLTRLLVLGTMFVRRAFTYVAGANWGIRAPARLTASSASSTTASPPSVPAHRQSERW